jgi:hypothetical protein
MQTGLADLVETAWECATTQGGFNGPHYLLRPSRVG